MERSLHRLLLLILFCCTGCYDSSFDERSTPSDAPSPTTTIAALHALHQGEITPIEGEVIVEGRVTANTHGGNFYHSLLLEQEGAAVEVLVGLDALHNDFPVGTWVVLSAKGLAVDRFYGILQIGVPPLFAGDPTLGYLASKPTVDQHLYRTDRPVELPTPQRYTLDQLTPTMAGRLIRIEGLQHTPDTPTESGWSGYRRFTDSANRPLYTYVRSYADFADKELPMGRCTLVGILQYDAAGEGRFILKPRNEQDLP